MSTRVETVITEAANALLGFSTGTLAREILSALKAARIAVVELPEPEYGPDGGGQFGWRSVAVVTATPNADGSWTVWDEDYPMTTDEAHDHAAALLAAADAAETS